MKKNCYNCEYLEWGFGDIGDPEGWVCNRNDFFGSKEKEMFEKMDRDDYREKSKKCHRPKESK